MKPNGKCITKKCEDCRFYENWDITKRDGLRSVEKKCSFEVLFKAIPQLIGSVDGCQQATNETRNMVYKYGNATKQAFEQIAENTTRLLPDGDS